MTTQPLRWPSPSEYIERTGSTIQPSTSTGEIPLGVPLLVVSHTGNVLHLEGPDQTGYDADSLDISRPGAYINRLDLGRVENDVLVEAHARLMARRQGSHIRGRIGMRLRRTDAVYFGYIPTGIEVTVTRIEDGPMLGQTLTLEGSDGQTYKFGSGEFTDKFFTVLAVGPVDEVSS